MTDELDELMTDDFLSSLVDPRDEETRILERPKWVSESIEHTTFKAWNVILELRALKEKNIKNYGRVADKKTPKALYEIKKADVANLMGISAQGLFRSSGYSDELRGFYDVVNTELLELFELEQNKQIQRCKKTGIRKKCKPELVNEVQILREKVNELECRTVKDTLDLMLKKMPLDLRRKLSI
ncbi:hypothetical protein [Pseudoalteromonas prydzensis]|uniref:hypothetical protein n=1 Tax=Pseudoalteromonas prydzensis TaxID=182141 RepID=UPI003FD15901